MPACEECYRAKRSCDRDKQEGACCSRCSRLGLECVARISRQGQGPRKRQKRHQEEQREERMTSVSEDGNILQAMLEPSSLSTSTSSPKIHYGIRYLVHSWSSFALARRSFTLLERACRLAAKCEIPMDDVFHPDRYDVIQPLLYNQTKQGVKADFDGQLRWEDLSPALWNLCKLDCLEKRFVMVREAKNGHSRYLASDKFQQDIVSVWSMEQTWKANDKPVVRLFLQGQADFLKFNKAINYQMSRYTHPDKTPGMHSDQWTPHHQRRKRIILSRDGSRVCRRNCHVGAFFLRRRVCSSQTSIGKGSSWPVY